MPQGIAFEIKLDVSYETAKIKVSYPELKEVTNLAKQKLAKVIKALK
jgi:hypothetical protein